MPAVFFLVCILFHGLPSLDDSPIFQLDLGKHAQGIGVLASSSDGKWLASGSEDGDVRVWDVSSPEPTHRVFLGERSATALNPIHSLAFSPDSRWLAVSGRLPLVYGSIPIRIYEVSSGRLDSILVGHSGSVTDCQFTTAGNRLVSVDARGSIRVWDLSNKSQIRAMQAKGFVHSIAILEGPGEADGLIIAAAGSKSVEVWNPEGPLPAQTVAEPYAIESLAADQRFRRFVYGVNSGNDAGRGGNAIVLCDASLKELQRIDYGDCDAGSDGLAFTPDGHFLAAGAGGLSANSARTHQPRLFPVQADGLGRPRPMEGWTGSLSRLNWQASAGWAVHADNEIYRLSLEAGAWHTRLVMPSARTYAIQSVCLDGTRLAFTDKSDLRHTGQKPFDRVFDLVKRQSEALAPDDQAGLSLPVFDLRRLHVRTTDNRPHSSWWTAKLVFGLGDESNAADGWGAHDHLRSPVCSSFVSPTGSWSGVSLSPGRAAASTGSQVYLFDTSLAEAGIKHDDEDLVRIRAILDHAPMNATHPQLTPGGRWALAGGADGVVTVWDLRGLSWIEMVQMAPLGGAAAEAGILPGDEIVAIDGRRFRLANEAMLAYPGASHRFTVRRGQEEKTFDVARKEGKFGITVATHPSTLVSPAYHVYFDTSGEWIIWTPQGWFDASPGCMAFVRWHINRGPATSAEGMAAERFAERFFRPDIIRRIVTGETAGGESGLPSLATAARGVPRVAMVTPPARVAAEQDQVAITIDIEETGGGIDGIRIMVNGKVLADQERGLRKVETIKRLNLAIPLAPGENRIRISAFNALRTESEPVACTVVRDAPVPAATLFVLGIGIDAYENPRYRLGCSVADATAFSRILQSNGSKLFSRIESRLLLNADARRPAIESAMAAFAAAAQPTDCLVVYFSGHGIVNENADDGRTPEFHAVLQDVTRLEGDPQQLAEKGLPISRLRELCTKVQAQKQIILLDACHAGAAIAVTRGAGEERALMQLSRATGAAVLAASSADQTAKEIAGLGHGLFTYALLEGLAGKAAGNGGAVTVQRLNAYLQETVPQLAERHATSKQYPIAMISGMDFPIVMAASPAPGSP